MRAVSVGPCFHRFLLSFAASAGLTGQSWAPIVAPTSPTARAGHTVAFDVHRGKVVLFGGLDTNNSELGDTWEWDGTDWLLLSTASAPTARSGHRMAFDVALGRVVMFGGERAGVGKLADTWAWDGMVWQQIQTTAAPAGRSHFGLAYDSWRGRITMFGGSGGPGVILGDTWELVGNDWMLSATTGPSSRQGCSVAFDDTRGKLLLFGGYDGARMLSDTWLYDSSGWQQALPSHSPIGRQGAAMSHDSLCGRSLLFGGSDNGPAAAQSESWAWDGYDWTAAASGNPSGRIDASLAFDAQRGRMVLLGGRDATGVLGDGWQLGSPCSRSMSLSAPPYIGTVAAFQYSHPWVPGHIYAHLLTARHAGAFALPVPGFASLGLARIDPFSVFVQEIGVLGASSSSTFHVAVPNDNSLAGIQFDVQSLDLTCVPSAIYWASNDVEAVIAPFPYPPPSANFFATGFPAYTGYWGVTCQAAYSPNMITSWEWDVGNDGTIEGVGPSVSWTSIYGAQTPVRLTVRNPAGSNSIVLCVTASVFTLAFPCRP